MTGSPLEPDVAAPPQRVRREISGILLLDKPVGMTSNQVLQRVKKLFHARKAGHTGSLDPLASGMLPLCFGEATKVSAYLLDADKRYITTCRLGVRTATADAEGEVLETCPVPPLDESRIEAVLQRFRGAIRQVPPMYSALRHQGQRLYDLAREGIEVPREPRDVVIHELKLLGYTSDTLLLDVSCSKGTYIRTLVEDIARALGTCGHVSELRRLAVGPFSETAELHTLPELEARSEAGLQALDEALIPVDSALVHWPAVRLVDEAAWYFCRGQAVFVPAAPSSGRVRVYARERFLGVGDVLSDGRIAPKRLLGG